MTTTIDGQQVVDRVKAGSIEQTDLAPNVAGNGPAFLATQTAVNTIAATYTKVLLGQSAPSPLNNFDTTNSRFQPTVAGVYQLNFSVAFASSAYVVGCAVYKNGVLYKYGTGGAVAIVLGSCLVELNGSTDYMELWAISATSQSTSINSASTSFSGFLARSATE